MSDSVEKRILEKYSGQLDEVARRIIAVADEQLDRRVLVCIAGVPGSGKSTTASCIEKVVNTHSSGRCCAIPMDGFHLTRKELNELENREEAIERRGAHWTFDADAFKRNLQEARILKEVRFSGFDHAACDPVSDAIKVPRSCQILLVEGNYVLFRGLTSWSKVVDLFDFKIYLDCAQEIATDRLVRRHVVCFDAEDQAGEAPR